MSTDDPAPRRDDAPIEALRERLADERAARASAEQRAARLARVHQLSLDLGAAETLERVVALTIAALDELFPRAGRTSVALLETGGRTLTTYMISGAEASLPIGHTTPVDRSFMGHVIKTRTPGRHVTTSPDGSPYAGARLLAARGFPVIISAPLIAKGDVFGTVNAAAALDALADDDERLLELVAATLAVNVAQWQLVAHLDGALERLRDSYDELARELAERTRAEQLAREGQRVIAEQHAQLLAMSAPIIPIRDDTLVIPLVGRLTEARARRVTEIAVAGVRERGAAALIFDHTGLEELDAQVASAVLRIAAALRLLGCRTLVTGIRPSLARTLVDMELDLTGLTVHATLEDAVRDALGGARAGAGGSPRHS
ncbi:MAG: STAS domain-containing protein [Myxococcales bacterium]|nr:STAS domain-containing protein [Myxococcales bacterium]